MIVRHTYIPITKAFATYGIPNRNIATISVRVNSAIQMTAAMSEVTGWLGYPYYMVWKHILTGQSPPKPRLPDDLDATPVAFLFGTEKRLFFHGSSFLAQLDGGARCLTRAFKCGHWVMDAYPEEVAEAVSGFLGA